MPGSVLRRAVSTARSVRAVIRQPPYVPPGHFYSPLTSGADVARALTWDDRPWDRQARDHLSRNEAPGIDLAEPAQLALARELSGQLAEPPPGPRYAAANPMFGAADAALYRGMLTRLRPARVVEVGSGYSTAIALDEAD